MKKYFNSKFVALLVAILTLLGGCKSAPNYQNTTLKPQYTNWVKIHTSPVCLVGDTTECFFAQRRYVSIYEKSALGHLKLIDRCSEISYRHESSQNKALGLKSPKSTVSIRQARRQLNMLLGTSDCQREHSK